MTAASSATATSVYVIAMDGSQLVKIGYTAGNPVQRMAGLQTGLPVALSLLWHREGSRALESALHARFAEHRVRGEWFDLSPLGDPVKQVEQAVAAIEAAASADDEPWPVTMWVPYDGDLPYYLVPREAITGRCACGHQAGTHGWSRGRPGGCCGEQPYRGMWFFDTNPCDCPQFDDSPSTIRRYSRMRGVEAASV
ncbi:GIY-YIG nuclease family protein [Streptomyces sp. NBC_01439]|uniref:GIY-YIG nuclease family protein n=1 Tax=Streptomyces sp. NBC_01439 TaxID=2903867 RepID=UPI002E2AAFB7|nr:GIY-YIG nuclease family protein [Streptomyces sp. NBC_01439]